MAKAGPAYLAAVINGISAKVCSTHVPSTSLYLFSVLSLIHSVCLRAHCWGCPEVCLEARFPHHGYRPRPWEARGWYGPLLPHEAQECYGYGLLGCFCVLSRASRRDYLISILFLRSVPDEVGGGGGGLETCNIWSTELKWKYIIQSLN